MNITDITKQIRAFADQLEEQNKPDAPPFQLPPPPPGMQWHRATDWAADMLPTGYRPVALGERIEDKSCESWIENAWVPQSVSLCCTITEAHRGSFIRTTRPLVFEHDGKQWTYHRPGDPMPCDGELMAEVLRRDKGTPNPKPADCWNWKLKGIDTEIIGWRYAEPITREVELGPEDVPPCSAVKGPSDGDNEYALVSGVGKRGIILSDGRVIAFSHMRSGWLLNRPNHRDSSGNPTVWEPCHKIIPQNG